MTKKKNRTFKRLLAQKKPTEDKALRRVAMFEALWDAVTRGADHDDRDH
ncbi:hypothetical protein OG594_02675 [Streptomyces sp. NBC_01214]|nr:hypothetical protein [Streptomyces sp. NBC_01214]MCX4800586.1 hypothetical protein [Streptomyces sp. NBC_01214]